MPAPVHDRLHVAVAIHEVTDRLVHLVTEAPDTSLRVPATPEWTVAQAFGHVATVAPRYIQAAHQQGEWTENAGRLPELNARQLASLPTLEPDVVAADLTATVATLTELVGSFGDGLTMNPPAFARPDVVISADPSAFLLVVYKRRSQWPAILTGKLAAWGRKPWLAVGFASLFHRP